MSTPEKIRVEHLQKSFRNATPLKDVNAVINEGDVVAVIGASGCGKSTFIRCINLIDRPTGGKIFIDGEEITARGCNLSRLRQRVGMVFQSYNLFEHLTVAENVMLAPMKLKHLPRKEAYRIACEQLVRVGLGEKLLQYPDQLSGGQRQRVSIARTLAMDPDILLLDEPTSALDPTMVREVETVIKNLARSGKTMLIVTHEMRLAKAIANRIFYLDQGVLYEEGSPEEIFGNPQRERTRAFVHHLKVLQMKFRGNSFDLAAYSRLLGRFLENNLIPPDLCLDLRRFVLRFAEEFLPQLTEEEAQLPFHLLVEYPEDGEKLRLLLYTALSPARTEPLLALLRDCGEDVCATDIADDDYRVKLSCSI